MSGFGAIQASAQLALHDHPRGFAFWALGILVAGAVGGTPERIAALALALNVVASIAFYPTGADQGAGLLLVEDLGVLAVLLALLWRYPRRWLLWAVALQLVTVATHLPQLQPETFDHRPWLYPYALVQSAVGYGVVSALILGALLERPSRAPERDPTSGLQRRDEAQG